MIKTVEYIDGKVRMIDQTRLPLEKVFVDCQTIEDVDNAIRTMIIRGAPAIGVAAAMGVSLAAEAIEAKDFDTFYAKLERQCDTLAKSRPTAVNLAWGIERMKKVACKSKDMSIPELKRRLKQEALDICEEDIEANKAIGRHGQALISDNSTILTHCNAGALATAGFGTALGVVRAAVNSGKNINVFADETRPFLQGARLTVWELMEDNIPVKLITDNMCGFFMSSNQIDVVVVGADRIASNGDVANKIGTYGLAVVARHHGVPFYVAAPLSTIDPDTPDGSAIEIEQRPAAEVAEYRGSAITPVGAVVHNPAFDVTPADLVDAIITEVGVLRAPFGPAIAEALGR